MLEPKPNQHWIIRIFLLGFKKSWQISNSLVDFQLLSKFCRFQRRIHSVIITFLHFYCIWLPNIFHFNREIQMSCPLGLVCKAKKKEGEYRKLDWSTKRIEIGRKKWHCNTEKERKKTKYKFGICCHFFFRCVFILWWWKLIKEKRKSDTEWPESERSVCVFEFAQKHCTLCNHHSQYVEHFASAYCCACGQVGQASAFSC